MVERENEAFDVGRDYKRKKEEHEGGK